eukprot:16362-Hanusia_phi.AAC.1
MQPTSDCGTEVATLRYQTSRSGLRERQENTKLFQVVRSSDTMGKELVTNNSETLQILKDILESVGDACKIKGNVAKFTKEHVYITERDVQREQDHRVLKFSGIVQDACQNGSIFRLEVGETSEITSSNSGDVLDCGKVKTLREAAHNLVKANQSQGLKLGIGILRSQKNQLCRPLLEFELKHSLLSGTFVFQLDDLSTMVLTNVDEFEENRESNHLQKQIYPLLLQFRKRSFNSCQDFFEQVHELNRKICHILSPHVGLRFPGEVEDWFSPTS